MRVAYLDTSAAFKLVVDEDGSAELESFLIDDPSRVLVSSWLLFTELHCAAGRRPSEIDEQSVLQALDAVEFVDVSRKDLLYAARLVPLRSNDAIHLAVALRLEAQELITYDDELAAAARRLGIAPVSPGVRLSL